MARPLDDGVIRKPQLFAQLIRRLRTHRFAVPCVTHEPAMQRSRERSIGCMMRHQFEPPVVDEPRMNHRPPVRKNGNELADHDRRISHHIIINHHQRRRRPGKRTSGRHNVVLLKAHRNPLPLPVDKQTIVRRARRRIPPRQVIPRQRLLRRIPRIQRPRLILR